MNPQPLTEMELYRVYDVIEAVLDRHAISRCLVGGLAVSVWGDPRTTYDLDMAILGDLSDATKLQQLLAADPAIVQNPHILPLLPSLAILRIPLVIETAGESKLIPVDLLLVPVEFSQSILDRSIALPIAGRQRKVCSPEDLVVLKRLSGRAKDLEDIHGIVRNAGTALDSTYVEHWTGRLGITT
ncbi:MAG: hypothetical protein NT069_22570 [Planctomycetota bacterium]|nr:hypothetical protein [Planctomycetota bacterium]